MTFKGLRVFFGPNNDMRVVTPEREGGIEVREIKREQCDMGLGLFGHKI